MELYPATVRQALTNLPSVALNWPVSQAAGFGLSKKRSVFPPYFLGSVVNICNTVCGGSAFVFPKLDPAQIGSVGPRMVTHSFKLHLEDKARGPQVLG